MDANLVSLTISKATRRRFGAPKNIGMGSARARAKEHTVTASLKSIPHSAAAATLW
jgi:hypothetical protein